MYKIRFLLGYAFVVGLLVCGLLYNAFTARGQSGGWVLVFVTAIGFFVVGAVCCVAGLLVAEANPLVQKKLAKVLRFRSRDN